MKRTFRSLSGVAGVIAGMACSIGFAAYVSDTFESTSVGAVPSAGNGWGAASGIIVSNQSGPVSGSRAMYVPVLSGVTNSATVSTNNGQVWTDFYTKPVLLSAAAPAVDYTATAQVFANSNGLWSTLSGAGNGSTVYTNTWLTVLGASVSYPTATVGGAWFHVSVLHDYINKNWSLFVNDKLLATNLGFISSGTASITNFSWFQVQNLGGDSSNVVWVDDFLVTNRVPVVLADTNSPGTTNGLTPAVSLTYFNTLEDPRPASTNFGADPVVGANAVSLQFDAKPNQHYQLIGGAAPLGAMTPIAGADVVVDAGGVSNSVADTSALSGGKTKYFYKIVTISPIDGSFALTNTETYAWYKQDRSTLSKWYYSGAPVQYLTAGHSTLAGLAGQQLAQGLHGDAKLNAPDLLAVGDAVFYLNGAGQWVDYVGTTDPSTIDLTPGLGVAIKRQIGAASQSYAVISGTWSNTIPAVTLDPGWNSLVWPYDTTATSANCGFPNTSGDMFGVLRGTSSNPQLGKYSGSWKTLMGGAIVATNWPTAGEGFRYYNNAGVQKQWTPTR